MLHHLLQRSLETNPERPILECSGSWTTAAELERLASKLASGPAAMGLEAGDRVALLLPNGLEAVVCYLACFRIRLVIVPLDNQYHPLQIGYALGHSNASMLIVSGERLPGLDEAGVLGAVPRVVVVGGALPAGTRRPSPGRSRSAASSCRSSRSEDASACWESSPRAPSSLPCAGRPPRRFSRSRLRASGS